MLLKALCKGNAISGVRVGSENARSYFTANNSTILLLLDHLLIECSLPAKFWQGEAEIRDWRLCAWLASKKHQGRSRRPHLLVELTPYGDDTFRVRLAEDEVPSMPRPAVMPAPLRADA